MIITDLPIALNIENRVFSSLIFKTHPLWTLAHSIKSIFITFSIIENSKIRSTQASEQKEGSDKEAEHFTIPLESAETAKSGD